MCAGARLPSAGSDHVLAQPREPTGIQRDLGELMTYEHGLAASCQCTARLSRRAALVGLVGVGASALTVSRAHATSPRAIDVHHHFLPPRMMEAARQQFQAAGAQTPTDFAVLQWTPAQSLEQMDQHRVATSIISQPTLAAADPATRRLIREVNEFGARVCADNPNRFGLFATLPWLDVDESLAEIAHAFDTLRADGVCVLTNYNNERIGDERFAPILDELNRRKAVVHVHPLAAPCCIGLQPNVPTALLEFPYDSTRTIANLLVTGTLARFPDIRFIFSHGGGALPALSGRLFPFAARPQGDDQAPNVAPQTLLRKHYFDTASITNAPGMAALTSLVTPSQILFGSDIPYMPLGPSLTQLNNLDLRRAQRRQILRENAERLFPRLQA